MKKLLRKLNTEDLDALMRLKGVHTFENDIDVLKCNEVPSAAVVIVDGEADVLKRNEEFLQISPGYAIGLDEVHQSSPARISLRCKKNLKAIILSKFDFSEYSAVHGILNQLICLA